MGQDGLVPNDDSPSPAPTTDTSPTNSADGSAQANLDPFKRAFLNGVAGTTELILVRHGQQNYPSGPNAAPEDFIDPPLSAIGQRQANTVGRYFADQQIDVVYSSHLQRAHETGRQIARHHGLEPRVTESIREVELFRDVPRGASLLESVDPLLLRGGRERFVQERSWSSWPLSESGEEFRARVLTAVEGILASHPGQRIVVACHGGVINTVVGAVLGVTEDMFFNPMHASTHRLAALGARRVVRSLNETFYLRAEDPALVTV